MRMRSLSMVALLIAASFVWAAAAQARTPGGNGFIAFERVDPAIGDTDIYLVSPDGGQPQLLWVGGGYPHWSPDGRQLAFMSCLDPPVCDTAFALLDPATGRVHGFSMPDPNIFTSCAVWAAGGTRLACEGQGQTDPNLNGVYTIRASDGGGLTRITTNPGGDDFPLDYSPDGARLVFTRTDPTRPAHANQALFVATAEGRNAHRITPWGFTDDQASWSPNGHLIVFGTRGSLYSVHPDGTGLTKIPLHTDPGTQHVNAFDVAWSPDGSRLVFSLRPAGSQHPSIYTATPHGRHLHALTTSPTGDHHANWGSTPAP
ncbi:MAG: TolB protein [Actinomycetota bacterium]|nr:TolB protein [Actinomycetota bacterium]